MTLAGAGQEISGDCECAAAESFGFCKHMVATALAANAEGGDVSDAENPLARIRAYLQALSVDALVALILETAERDEALMRRLDLASASVGADDAILEERLSAALDEAIEPRGYIGYSEARDWAAGVDEALDAVEELSGRAERCDRIATCRICDRRPRKGARTASTIRPAIAAASSNGRRTSTWPRRARPRRNPSLSRTTFSRARRPAISTLGLARQAATPTRSATPGSRNIVASPKRPGRSCPRARDAPGSPYATTALTGGFRESSTSLPSATAMSRRASPCAPRTFRRPGPIAIS